MGPEVLPFFSFFNSLQKSGAEIHALKSLCFFMRLPHISVTGDPAYVPYSRYVSMYVG